MRIAIHDHNDDIPRRVFPPELESLGEDAYIRVFCSSSRSLPTTIFQELSGPCLDRDVQSLLLAPVTAKDIKDTLFSIGNDKAPSPDDFSSVFFKKAWGVVAVDFCAAVKDFFISSALLKQVNHAVIALIPKSVNVNSVKDFRPISCCNVTYKVISKILAGRLAKALQCIISPAQNAFLGGRKMADNIYMVQELLRNYGRKRSSPRCLIKIDFCVETTSFSVAVNGDLFGFFPGKGGIRQRNPLSPYLFIASMEYFARLLNIASANPEFKYHPKCLHQKITHLAFADDILLVARGDRSSVHILHQQLLHFNSVSGLEINARKSSIYFGGVGGETKHRILQATGFSEGSFPFKYLGVPLSPHRLLVSQFSPLLEKLEMAIQSWLGKHLSYAGRLELLKSVLQGMVQFWIGIFPMPEQVIKKITGLCRNFFWSGNAFGRASAPVAWANVCLPKKEGGLGLMDLRARNLSFIANHLWNIHIKADSLWIQWVHHYYLNQTPIWHAGLIKNSSPLWKAIFNLKKQLVQDCGGQNQVISLIQSWHNGPHLVSSCAYEHFRVKNPNVGWVNVVWEVWSLPRYSFIHWLTVLGRLRTRDRLRFVPTDTYCIFCRQEEESHMHHFFNCSWTSDFWRKITCWLGINRRMATLTSAIRGLGRGSKVSVARMRRVSLGLIPPSSSSSLGWLLNVLGVMSSGGFMLLLVAASVAFLTWCSGGRVGAAIFSSGYDWEGFVAMVMGSFMVLGSGSGWFGFGTLVGVMEMYLVVCYAGYSLLLWFGLVLVSAGGVGAILVASFLLCLCLSSSVCSWSARLLVASCFSGFIPALFPRHVRVYLIVYKLSGFSSCVTFDL
ncbi:uncharacterized protein LOC120003588 [Tripterygium wilfordii]|uniref:uncharacterized protein LOC120003588 n=1 Tax=Tripterygium wilfordii TaxID=458696 RepID=UPI0018F8070D|nr:uncharacterized protein LOC120003588 [Tripterygium wilfordii]